MTDLLPISLLREIALIGLVLNAVWEFAHLTLYTCWDKWRRWQRLVYPLLAILGDALIMVGIALFAARIVGAEHLVPPDASGWLGLVATGFAVSILLEAIAVALGLWSYKVTMPTLRIGTWRIGLSPILQVTLLPAFSVFLATL